MTHLPIDPDLLDDAWSGRTGEPETTGGHRGRLDWRVLVAVALGGGAGSLLRYGLLEAVPATSSGFPWATFVVNLGGCLMIGALMVAVTEVWAAPWWPRPLLGVGLLGGLTTYSTMMLDVRGPTSQSEWAASGGYLAGSVLSGLLAVWAGIAAVRLLARHAGHGDAVEARG